MGAASSKFQAFDLLQTPVWIIYNGEIWYANGAARSLLNDSWDFADLPDPGRHGELVLTVEGTSYICYLTDIEIEEGKNALLVEACLDPRYEMLLEASPDAVMIVDADTGNILHTNSKLRSLTARKAEQLNGVHYRSLYTAPEGEEESLYSFIGGWGSSFSIPRQDRPPVPVSIYSTLFVLGNKKYVYSFLRDLTIEKQIEEEWCKTLLELEKREHQLSIALSSAQAACWEYDPNTERVEVIGTFRQGDWRMDFWEMTLAEGLAYIYPPDVQGLQQAITSCGQGSSFIREIRLADFDTNPRWFLVSGRRLFDADGKPDRVVGIAIETTQNKQMELELNRQRRLMEWVMAHIPAFIGVKDSQSRYIYANGNLLQFLGVSLADVLGKTNQEIYTPDLAIIFDYMDHQILLKKKPLQTEVSVITNGRERIYLTNKFPLLNEKGEVEAIGSIATDITGLKQAEDAILENQAYLNCLIEIQQQLLMNDGRDFYPHILQRLGEVSKASRVYIFANHRSEDGTLLTSQIHEWCAPGIKPEIDNPELQNVNMELILPRWIQYLSQGQEISGVVADFPVSERQILEPQGIQSILVLPLLVNREFWGFIGFDNCISTAPWSEGALGLLRAAASAISLHLERQQSRQILIEERRKAEEANRAKSQFLANMSHELRTPMNGVIGLTSILQTTNLNPEQQDYIRIIRQSGETLLALINDILDFSKIESGRIELEMQDFNLRSCLENVINVIYPQLAQKGLQFFLHIAEDVPLWIRSDVTRLRQILLNLLSNAVKFTEEGLVSVNVWVEERYNDRELSLAFAVIDEGIGIPADRLHSIFDPFTQADSSITRRYGGTGLGLSICQRLTHLLGGKIKVESHQGYGSIFTFTIKTEAIPPLRSLPPLPPKNIALQLQEYSSYSMLASILRGWGMQIVDTVEKADLLITDDRQIKLGIPTIFVLEYGESYPLPLTISKPLRHDVLCAVVAQALNPQIIESSGVAKLCRLYRMPLRILVAEDNVVNQKVCLKILEKLGYQAELVANGLEAIEAVQRQVYDVILMDIQMPEMDGLTATRLIRERSDYQPWIIALTADAQTETAQQSYDLGVNDYLTKPIRLEELSVALQRAYRHRQDC